ncbi:MAG TPA: septation ring formation regulator EzrA [Pseudogracilibacillus sp.]|nr:septation ring formation regulator EzrA [Pseudogracilibacillus sp.]
MEYVIGVILIVIVLVMIVLLFRKRIYDQIDYYENWKFDIMDRNIAGKLTEIKPLSSEGEAKEKLTNWKEEWDSILLNDLADVEELLFDTERAADRFRIGTARKHVSNLETCLVEIEKKIDTIETDIERFIETEETSRETIEQIAPNIKDLRRKLMNERNKYGRASTRFESELDEVMEDIRIYEQLVEAGTYTEAASVVEKVKQKANIIETALEDFPALYERCTVTLPNKLDDLYKSVQEMETEGYFLEPLHAKRTINDLQARLLDYVAALENIETEKVKNALPDTEEQIDDLYEKLEQEVIAKNFTDSKYATFSQSLERFTTVFSDTKEEVEQLKKTYHFEDRDLETYMGLEKQMNELSERHDIFEAKLQSHQAAYSELRDDLTANITQLEKLEKEHDQFKEELDTLRKDEIEAREQIEWMTESLSEAKRKLRLSNLPGIPNFVINLLDEATTKTERVNVVLEKQPLDIVQLQKTLQEAKQTVDQALEQTETIIDQAKLTEVVIQYANRYRSRDPILAARLLEAEELFRKADYELALEQATEALRERDPQALEKIEEIHKKIIA